MHLVLNNHFGRNVCEFFTLFVSQSSQIVGQSGGVIVMYLLSASACLKQTDGKAMSIVVCLLLDDR